MSHSISNTTLVRRDRLRQLKEREKAWFDLGFLKAVEPEYRSRCIDLLDQSKSQLRQDLFALSRNGFERDRFFVEFGATDGVELNNTHLLEHAFGWRGILAEPARGWHDDLKKNRSCTIETRCVWNASGEKLGFTEAPRGENSGISTFVKSTRRLRGQNYEVETISLNDLLESHGAPAHIDYISIDTEGSELDILTAVDFDKWSFGAMTIEHNFQPQRQPIHALLTEKGYVRVLEDCSQFDDWYVPAPRE
ncbi:FkbM family methyltransferase [Lutimaribacter marinistellae]|uniref:FkbM family methyltransferase n=1 Tax=Lutimaribacter marinistellae TaxID=1820329 RepID=A0ABV7TM62_9RHOB